jgi:hypothetical protein
VQGRAREPPIGILQPTTLLLGHWLSSVTVGEVQGRTISSFTMKVAVRQQTWQQDRVAQGFPKMTFVFVMICEPSWHNGVKENDRILKHMNEVLNLSGSRRVLSIKEK